MTVEDTIKELEEFEEVLDAAGLSSVSVMVEIYSDVDELEVVFCPVCKSPDPFSFDVDESLGDGYAYQCQGCGAEFVITSGPVEPEED